MVPCHAPSFTSKASTEGNYPQFILWMSIKNWSCCSCVNDIEDDVFQKAIYCLFCDVFPALKVLRYCDSNISARDKIIFLVKWVDYALLDSQLLLDDQDLYEGSDFTWLQWRTRWSNWRNKYRTEWWVAKVRGFLFCWFYFEASWHIWILFSKDDDNDEFTLGNAVSFAWKKWKKDRACICSDSMSSFFPTWHSSWLYGTT